MDSRFHLKAVFEVYGKEYEWDTSLNWCAETGEIDHRITEWFSACYEEAYAEWRARNAELDRKRDAERLKEREIAELRRLQEKYGAANE